MPKTVYDLILAEQQKKELSRVLACNEKTVIYGLSLTEQEAGQLLVCRRDSLKEQRRVEFKEGILPKLIETFCDSDYLEQEDYADTLAGLMELFYLYKNESANCLTDDELLAFMREQFDGVCGGSLDYLGETCLERFSRAVRADYREYEKSQGRGEYERLSEEPHWDSGLYQAALRELFWE